MGEKRATKSTDLHWEQYEKSRGTSGNPLKLPPLEHLAQRLWPEGAPWTLGPSQAMSVLSFLLDTVMSVHLGRETSCSEQRKVTCQLALGKWHFFGMRSKDSGGGKLLSL